MPRIIPDSVIQTTGSGNAGGPYSLNITDSPGSLSATVYGSETDTLTDTATQTLKYTATDAQTLLESALTLTLSGLSDNETLSHNDTQVLTYNATDAQTLSHSDTQALKYSATDAQTLNDAAVTLTLSGFTDSQTLSETHDTFIECFCSTAAGTNVTNPTNAQGQANGTFATMAPTLTSTTATLTCTIGGIPTTGTFTTKKIYVWYTVTTAKGALDTWSLTYTTTSITTAQTLAMNTSTCNYSYTTFPLTFDVSTLTLAQLAGLKIIWTDTSALGDAYTVDAVALVLEGGI